MGDAKAGQGTFLLGVPRACSRMEQVCTSGDALSTTPIKTCVGLGTGTSWLLSHPFPCLTAEDNTQCGFVSQQVARPRQGRKAKAEAVSHRRDGPAATDVPVTRTMLVHLSRNRFFLPAPEKLYTATVPYWNFTRNTARCVPRRCLSTCPSPPVLKFFHHQIEIPALSVGTGLNPCPSAGPCRSEAISSTKMREEKKSQHQHILPLCIPFFWPWGEVTGYPCCTPAWRSCYC